MIRTIAVVAVAGLALAGCSGKTAGSPRKPLELPAAAAFKSGTCSTIADPVLSLGRFTYDKANATTLSDADRAELVVQGEKLKSAVESAEPAMADQMMQVLMSIGFVRIRIGKTYDPKLLTDVEAARTRLQTTCTT